MKGTIFGSIFFSNIKEKTIALKKDNISKILKKMYHKRNDPSISEKFYG